MPNGVVQHKTVEKSTSIDLIRLKYIGTSPCISASFTSKGTNFRDFLFASLQDKSLPKASQLVKKDFAILTRNWIDKNLLESKGVKVKHRVAFSKTVPILYLSRNNQI